MNFTKWVHRCIYKHNQPFKMMKINEEYVLSVVRNIISEETMRVSRNDYNKIQYKIEEMENCLVETSKELRKVNDSMPQGLKTISDKRLKSIQSSLDDAHKIIKQLQSKIKEHKRSLSQSSTSENK